MSSPSEVQVREEAADQGEAAGEKLRDSPDTRPGPTPETPPKQDIEDVERDGIALNTKWSFFYDKTAYGTPTEAYEDNLKLVYTVSTVQGFWCVYNNLPDVHDIRSRCGYHLMRGTQRPMWEDFPSGGVWKLRIPKSFSAEVWRELLLAAIGEQFTSVLHRDDRVVGISVTTRQVDDVVNIWNANSEVAADAKIKEKVLELVPKLKMANTFYKAHRDTISGSKPQGR